MSGSGPGLAPGLGVLRRYERRWWRGDVVAGLTVSAYLVPQVMAYATVAGLPPAAGLWTIVPALVVYAALGSSRELSVGPESTTALMAALALAPLAAGDAGRYAALAAAMALVVGALAVLGRVLRLGVVADLLSRPVLVGYLAGVAALMIAGQLGTVTGASVPEGPFLTQVVGFAAALGSVDPVTVAFSAAVLAALLLLHRVLPRLPGPLAVVLLATAAVAAAGPVLAGLAVVGPVPPGLPVPRVPAVTGADLAALVLPAAGVLLVGYSDTILTARAFAARAGRSVDADAELLALGGANLAVGLLHGFPVSSSGSRTAIGVAAGAHTQLHSLVAAGAVTAVLVAGGGVLARFPRAALGALIVYAALLLVDVPGFRRLAAFRRSELLLAVATLLGVLTLGLLPGVAVAVGLSVLDLLLRVGRPHDAVLGLVPGLAGMHDVADYPGARTIPGLVVYRYDSPLFFANAEDFRRRALAAVAAQPDPVRWFLLNAEANVGVDLTALDAVDSLRRELTGRGVVVALARVKHEVYTELDAYGLIRAVGPDRVFATLPTAVAAYERWCRQTGAPPPPGG